MMQNIPASAALSNDNELILSRGALIRTKGDDVLHKDVQREACRKGELGE